jgi:hypothetical protein
MVPDTNAAETSVRLTQERNLGSVHTLAAVQAETEKLKEARAGLLRYLGSADAPNDQVWYLEGRIAEALGLKDVAAGLYNRIPKAQHPVGDGAYDIEQVRLKVLGAGSHLGCYQFCFELP